MTDMTEETTAYWRQQAAESDRVEWCESCEKSYWKHYDECPHLNHGE